MVTVEVPAALAARARLSPSWAGFVEALPRLVGDLLDEWSLSPDGEPAHGRCALVLPVRTFAGAPAVLKVGWPHEEAEHEALVLQHWHGEGAVRLLRADPRRFALLLERLHPSDLTDVWDVEACEVVGGLYRRLHIPAPPQLRTLTSYVGRWTERLATLPRDAPVPHRLVGQAVSLGRAFVADPASDGTVIHGDLHYGNVLAADREPWLVIDPKPVSGDPHYEVAPLLWNRFDELAGGVREGVRRRFHATVDAAELDEDRARDWVVVRTLHQVLWALEERPEAPDRAWLTACVAIAKAVQD
ncbi:aminoglycoside phosphotransferase family protein [Nocardioides sp. cx-173]|uniref:aminoglycoside phosphotransferase family protein n=1 Tax=Nocardioides sp. cx-173 TaxID=2898796 RepID=UPI001E3393E9|nr:aminoglycoside phosphotransferase family protein [Nocardioides sp. cx-173]MCD4526289.1 aminoglycoside phosphotransferase family protein [Nocardioides sp. cx-173]UGB40503.1 aminoglycoside phosphotransferase family protein [Nocardioides sp. cx-173]